MIEVINGNILTHKGIIGHQVNCRGVMGAGLAKQIRNAFPRAYESYKRVASSECLGSTQLVSVSPDVIIANIFAQDNFGRYQRHTDYKAMTRALKQLKIKAKDKPIALPYGLGSGLAGGDWNIVQSIIDEVFHDTAVTLYKFGGK